MKLYLEVTPGYQIPIDVDENGILYDVLSENEKLSSLLGSFEFTFRGVSVSPFITLKRQNINPNDVIKLIRVRNNRDSVESRQNDQTPQSTIGTVFRGIFDEMSRLRDMMYSNVELQVFSRSMLYIDTEEPETPRETIPTRIFHSKELTDEPLPVPWTEPGEEEDTGIDERARFEELVGKFTNQTNLGDIITMLLEQDWEW